MKIIEMQVSFSSVRSRRDGSLGISMETPELSIEDKVEVMKLHGQVLDARFRPVDSPDVPEHKVNADLNQKSPSQRLRACLYILHQQSGVKESFEDFYNKKMEQIIDAVKGKLND